MKARVLVFVLALAVVLAIPTPSRAVPHTLPPPDWARELPGGARGLAVANGLAVATSDSDHVHAYDLAGRTRWQTTVPGLGSGHPAIGPNIVLVGATERVVALSARDGSVRWHQPMATEVTGVAVAGRVAVAGDHDGTLRVFDARRGTVLWSVRHDGMVWSAPAVDSSASVVVALWSEAPAPAARAFELTTGAPRWEQPVGLFTAAPGVGAGRAFLATGDGHHRAWVADFDLERGESDWVVEVPASFHAGIVPAHDARDLVLIDQLGRVSAIDPVSGVPRWTRALDRRVIQTDVVLLARRVVVTTLSRELFVLDRASGRVVAHTDSRRLGGFPAAVARAGRGDRVVLAYRLAVPGRVELRRVP